MKACLVSLDYYVPSCDTNLDQLPVTIGSSRLAGIRLVDPSVGHYHCRIEKIDGQLVVSDLGAVHGTFVNGARVSRSPLVPGDTLGIGMLSFFLQCLPESDSSAPIDDHAPMISSAALAHAVE